MEDPYLCDVSQPYDSIGQVKFKGGVERRNRSLKSLHRQYQHSCRILLARESRFDRKQAQRDF